MGGTALPEGGTLAWGLLKSLGLGGISRLLWTSQEGSQGKVVVPGMEDADPHTWGSCCGSAWGGRSTWLLPKAKQAPWYMPSAYMEPTHRWRQMGQGEMKPLEAAHSCHLVLSQV